MNNSYGKKATSETIHENFIYSTTTTKSSIAQDRKKFVVEKEQKNMDHEFLKNKILRNETSIHRRSKHDQNGRDYLCSKCWKSYLSYAAIYVHLKKKHQITIEDLKTAYIKRNKISPVDLLKQVRLKKKYKNFELNFDSIFEQAFSEVFGAGFDKYSEFITEEILNCNNSNYYTNTTQNLNAQYKFKLHTFYYKIRSIHMTFVNKELLETVKNSELMKNLDDAISLYLFSSWNVNNLKENLNNLKIAFLFREYLNFVGWENLRIMADYQIVEFSDIKYEEDFTKITLGNYLPELLDDFIGVYLKKDCAEFDSDFSEVKEFVSELCNMLYNENLISYMIEPLED